MSTIANGPALFVFHNFPRDSFYIGKTSSSAQNSENHALFASENVVFVTNIGLGSGNTYSSWK